METSYLDGMCKVFKLGIMCSATLPSSRPSMKEVLQILLRCGEGFAFGEGNVRQYDGVPLLKNSKWESSLDAVDNDSDSD